MTRIPIKFNGNFQWSTTSRDVKDGNAAHITREPERVKAFRDTWRDGMHSYLTYLWDRLSAYPSPIIGVVVCDRRDPNWGWDEYVAFPPRC